MDKTETEEKVIDLTDTLGNMSATLKDIQGFLVKADEKKEVPPAEPAKAPLDEPLEEFSLAGVMKPVTSIKVMGVPVGAIAGGTFFAVFATELLDGFMKSSSVQTRGIAKVAIAIGTAGYGKKLIGADMANIVAILLTFDALRDLTPIDSWAASAASKISGFLPNAGLADRAARRAPQTIGDYYAQAEGRR
jgi:hypothetical protein